MKKKEKEKHKFIGNNTKHIEKKIVYGSRKKVQLQVI